jgi:DNA-binding NarL/FixJ family response regulator
MSMSVLVADDQSMVRAGFGMLLSGQDDIEVVAEASSGREAVHKAMRLRPTVVLMDIRMPELDGLQATRRTRGRRQCADPHSHDVRPGRIRL